MAESAGISKKRRTRLSLGEQAEAVRRLRKGDSAWQVMRVYGIGRRTVTKLRKNGDDIIRRAELGTNSLSSKSSKSALYPSIETKLYEFVTFCRASKLPVTCATLQQKAVMIRDALLQNCSDQIEAEKLSSFTASKGWAVAFVNRHALRSVSLSGEGGSASALEVATDMTKLREALTKYDAKCIFNVDETGLFFKLLPRRTYICAYENRKSVRGTKAMRAKDRVTAYVCTNATGVKVPMAIIGKAKSPRCFRIETPPVTYFSQRNAWSDSATFKQWFYNIFLPFVRRFTSRPVALVMDNCGPHGTDLNDPQEQVNILTLPPNCTAIHQPMDLGIIGAWKLRYRRLLLQEIVKNLESRQARRDGSAELVSGMRGLAEGHDPHMLDVARLCSESWDLVTEMTICRCWVKSDMLPRGTSTDLNATFGRMSNTSREEEIMRMVEMFKKITIAVDLRDPLYEYHTEDVGFSDVSRWSEIESDVEVQTAMVDDDMHEFMDRVGSGSIENSTTVENRENCAQDDSDEEVPVSRLPLPPLSELFSKLNDLEKVSYDGGVTDALRHIRKLRSLLVAAKFQETRKTTRQLLITELFTRD